MRLSPRGLITALIAASLAAPPALAELVPYYRHTTSRDQNAFVLPPTPGVNGLVLGKGDLRIHGPVQVRARIGVGFSLQFTADNAKGATTWAASGRLPDGLSISPGGLLSGVPTVIQSVAAVRIEATDAEGRYGVTQPFTIDVRPIPYVASLDALSLAAGDEVSRAPTVQDVYGTQNWRVVGDLPVGLTLDTRSGRLSGTAEQKGSFPDLALGVLDADGAYGQSAPFSIEVSSKLGINGLQAGYAARAGKRMPSIQPYAVGTPGPFRWDLAAGSLPEGLTIDRDAGTIFGTPKAKATTAASLRAIDTLTGDRVASPNVTFRIGGPPAIQVEPSYVARSGSYLSVAPKATDLIGAGRWSLTGQVPSGLTFSPASGGLSGNVQSIGTYRGLNLKVIDLYDGATAYSPAFDITVAPQMFVGGAMVPVLQVEEPVTLQAPVVSGNIGGLGWAIDGTLPDGLRLDPVTGTVTGTPSKAGTSKGLRYVATDAADKFAASSSPSNWTVEPLGATVPFAVGPLAESYPAPKGRPLTIIPTVQGAKGAQDWTVNGSLPAWASFDRSTGRIVGTPGQDAPLGPVAGLSFSVSDAKGQSGSSLPFSIEVTRSGALVVSPPASLVAAQGRPFASGAATALNAEGGLGYVLAEGSLPDGVSLNPANGEMVGTPAISGAFEGLVLRAVDDSGASATSAPFTMTVTPMLVGDQMVQASIGETLSTALDVPLAATPSATGLIPPLSWTVAAGTLPAWLSLDPASGTLSGKTAVAGTWSGLALKAVDATGNGARTNGFTVIAAQAPPPSASMPAMVYGRVGKELAVKASAYGASALAEWTLGDGAFPAGFGIGRSTGVLTGTPSAEGTTTGLTVVLNEVGGVVAPSNPFTLKVVAANAPLIQASIGSVLYGTVGYGFEARPSASATTGAQAWSLTAGTLPAGLFLETTTGLIHGTPSAVGDASGLVLTVKDATNETGSTNPFTISVAQVTSISANYSGGTYSPAGSGGASGGGGSGSGSSGGGGSSGTVGSGSTGSSGGSGSGTVGSPGSGSVSGSGGTSASGGYYGGASGSSSGYGYPYSYYTYGPSAGISGYLYGMVDHAFNAAPWSSNTRGAVTWRLVSGTLPAGLALNAATGAITGVPRVAGSAEYLYLQVTDAAGFSANAGPFHIIVQPIPTLSLSMRDPIAVTAGDVLYSAPQVSGSLGGTSFSLSSGTLPSWATLDRASGAISGTAGFAATYAGLRISVTDGEGRTAVSNPFSLSVSSIPPLTASADAPTPATVGRAYALYAVARNAKAALSWKLAGGTIPPGLKVDPSSGAMAGTPTTPGKYDGLILEATEVSAPSRSAKTQAFAVTVARSQLVATAPTASNNSGGLYVHVGSQLAMGQPKVAGGVGVISWSSSSPLPPGLSVNASNGTLSGTASAVGSYGDIVIVAKDAYDGASTALPALRVTVLPVPRVRDVPTYYTARYGFPLLTSAPSLGDAAPGAVAWRWHPDSTPPAWAKVDPATGSITGTPDSYDTVTGLRLLATDVLGASDYSVPFELNVYAKPAVILASQTRAYKARIATAPPSVLANATGIVGTPAWSIVRKTGTLPPGMAIMPDAANPQAARLSGTFTGAGTATFVMRVTDGRDGSTWDSDTLQVQVEPALKLEGIAAAYRVHKDAFLATDAPLVSGIQKGATYGISYIPPGMTFANGAAGEMNVPGVLYGSPTQVVAERNVTLTVTDGWDNASTSHTFALAVLSEMSVSGVSDIYLRTGTDSAPRSFTPVAAPSVASGSVAWSLFDQGGILPVGVAVNPSTGRLSGIPSAAGTFSGIKLLATDIDNASNPSAAFAVRVFAPLAIAGGDAGTYQAQEGVEFPALALTGSNLTSAANGTWSSTGLPGGLALANGTVSGMPVLSGRAQPYPVTVTLSDSGDGTSVPKSLSIQVAPSAIIGLPASATATSTPSGAAGACTNVPVTNKGSAALANLAYAVSPGTEFGKCAATAQACGTTLAGNASCNVGVHLVSGTVGTRTGTLTVTADNAVTKSVSTSLTGVVQSPLALYPFTAHTFTTCGASGRFGPALSTCKSSYASVAWAQNASYFNITTTGYQEWIVPADGTYRIQAYGAAGGNGAYVGGNGAGVQSDVTLKRGQKLFIVVGQRGLGSSTSSGGGGATYVATGTATYTTATPLIVAGGGGGGNSTCSGIAATYVDPSAGGSSCGTATSGGNGGLYSLGICIGSNPGSGGGGGFLTDGGGAGNQWGNGYGNGFRQGATGGASYTGDIHGGFGGGVGSHTNNSGSGAGGGYSGGGAPNHGSMYCGGGGSSYMTGTNQTRLGMNAGAGAVMVEKL